VSELCEVFGPVIVCLQVQMDRIHVKLQQGPACGTVFMQCVLASLTSILKHFLDMGTLHTLQPAWLHWPAPGGSHAVEGHAGANK